MRRVVCLIALLPLLAACGGGESEGGGGGGGGGGSDLTVDGASVQREVSALVQRETGAQAEVKCPNDEKAVKGVIVACEVRAEDGTTTVANATITAVDEDADPPIDTDINVPIVPTAKIEADAPQQLRGQIGQIEIDCPTIVPIGDQLDFECPITSPADADGVVVKVTGAPDDLKYETVRD